MADPAAWAVTAFATTSFMLGMYQTGLLNAAGTPIVSRTHSWRLAAACHQTDGLAQQQPGQGEQGNRGGGTQQRGLQRLR